MGENDPTWATQDPSATLRPAEHARATGATDALLQDPGVALAFGQTLGTGGMGIVRVAQQPRMQRPVAVKSLKDTVKRQGATRKLLEEAWITGLLQHPNIVPIYDIAIDQDRRPHILMKPIEGTSWSELMGNAAEVERRFATTDLLGWNLDILASVCDAVRFAHTQDVLHRDLKPDNVMIGSYGEVYLVDWGIAITLQPSDRLPMHDPGRVVGTPRYLAPEMARAEHAGPATDVYLLGGILHHILTGRPPHRGTSIAEILDGIPTFVPHVQAPALLSELLQQSMHLDPTQRPDAAGFRHALQEFTQRRASEELTQRSMQQLEGLKQAVNKGSEQVYPLLSACRFGFQEALRAWPENTPAREGLDQALLTVLEHELTRENPRAARLLLQELDRPDLERRLAALEVHIQQGEAHIQALAADADPRIGARTRLTVSASAAGIWTFIAAISWVWLGLPPVVHQVALPAAMMLLLPLFLYWGRESFMATPLNRRSAGLVAASPPLHFLFNLLLWHHGADPGQVAALDCFLFGVLGATALPNISWRLWPTPVACICAAFLGSWDPPNALGYMAVALGVFTANLLAMWLPGLPDAPVYREADR